MKFSILNPSPERLNVMKKIYFVLAVLVAATLISCEKEQSFTEMPPVPEGGIAFTIQNVTTRSSAGSVEAVKGVTIPVGQIAKGESLFFEETIEQLNPLPGTKGTPAYSINVGNLYTTMGVYADAGSGNFQDDAIYERMDTEMYDRKVASEGKGWRYQHVYPGADPWPNATSDVDFYLRMPADMAGVTDLTNSDKKISFKFTSQYTAAAQKDILFSQTTLTKEQHNGFLPNGAPVLMYHALTGVKFRTGHDNLTGTKTIITKVVLTNLYDKGECTIDLSADNKVQWPAEKLGMSLGSFSQEFKNQDWSSEAGVDGTVGYSKDAEHPENDKFGDSWYSAAADKNLNNENGEWTFWFIPQEISDDVQLQVYFRVKTKDTQEGTEIIHTINFGELINQVPDPSNPGQTIHREHNVKWEAGQLRTYTLKPLDVDVDIFDKLEDYTKSDLHVTNTGNVDEYVRMLVIGNWYGWESEASKTNGDEPSILVGYTSPDPSNNEMVTPWSRWETDYGNFDASFLGGELAAGRTDWVRASGGYYYTQIIGPGEMLPNTKPLFSTYTLTEGNIPTIYIPSNTSATRVPAYGVHLVMEVVVQAIGVPKKENGHDVWWKQAWYDATGIEKLKPTADEEAAHAND